MFLRMSSTRISMISVDPDVSRLATFFLPLPRQMAFTLTAYAIPRSKTSSSETSISILSIAVEKVFP